MSREENDFRIRPGRVRTTRAPKPKSFVAEVLKAARKAGPATPHSGARSGSPGGSGFGRGLNESLQSDETKAEAAEIVRTLVDRVTLVPEEGRLAVVLRGDLAAMLRFAAGKKKPDVLSEVGLVGDLLSPTSMVAGTRNTRFLRLVEGSIPRLAA